MMKSCVRPVKRECVPRGESQLNDVANPMGMHRGDTPMIHCKLLIATAITASVVIAACDGERSSSPTALSTSGSIAADRGQSRLLYATVPPATGAATQLVAANFEAMRVRVIGSTGFPFSAALAFCPSEGKGRQEVVTYTMINTFDPTAQLAKLDLRTGVATKVGSPRGQALNIMGMTCSPDGTLYAIGQSNPTNTNFNSLYTLDRETGFASRIGSTGVNDPTRDPGFSGFLMALAFAPDGALYGVNTGTLFHVDRLTGVATKLVDLVAVGTVMGLAIDEDGKFYVADWVTGSRIYTLDLATGMATPILNTGLDYVHNIAFKPQGFSSGHELANGGESRSGALHVTKECSAYTGLAGSFCTISSSNVKQIDVASRVVYARAAGATLLDTDVILYAPGRGNNTAFGHVVLDFVNARGTATFSGGTGKFTGFHASVAVSYLGGPNWAWDGTYSFSDDDSDDRN